MHIFHFLLHLVYASSFFFSHLCSSLPRINSFKSTNYYVNIFNQFSFLSSRPTAQIEFKLMTFHLIVCHVTRIFNVVRLLHNNIHTYIHTSTFQLVELIYIKYITTLQMYYVLIYRRYYNQILINKADKNIKDY